MLSNKLALRPKQACEMLGVCLRTLWTWTKEGRIPHIRMGKVVLYPVAELEAWLRKQSQGTGQFSSNPSDCPRQSDTSSGTTEGSKRQSQR